MANKYTLEMHADATIVQKGSEAEKKVLRERLMSEIQSWERVYGESNIDGLWYKLSKVDLGDAETRKGISEFIQNERKLKWGDAGADFEIPFAVLEKNMAAADTAAADKAKWAAAATRAATIAEGVLAKDVSKVDEKVKQRALEYNTKQIKWFSERIGAIREGLTKKHSDIGKKLAEVEKNPTYDNAYALQRVIKAYDASIIVSPPTGAAKWWQDGFFGELTMSGLEKIAWIKKAPSKPEAHKGAGKPGEGGGVPAKPGQSADSSQSGAAEKKNPGNTTPSQADVRKSDDATAKGGSDKPSTSPSESDASKRNPSKPIESKDAYKESVEAVKTKLAEWRQATKGADGFSNNAEIESHGKLIAAAQAALILECGKFMNTHVRPNRENEYGKQNLAWVYSIYNEIAGYRRGEGNIGNKHYRDPLEAESILKLMLAPQNGVEFPKLPSEADMLAKLDEPTKWLIRSYIDSAKQKGKSFEEALGEALGNPTIKGAWERVREYGLWEYEKKMLESIKALESKKLSTEERKSLSQLKEIYGANGWWHMKDSTKAKWVVGRDQLLAVGLGIAGTAFTLSIAGAEVGIPMLVTAAAIGGAATTGASMLMEQRRYGAGEMAAEGAINTGTFLLGWLVFKLAHSTAVVTRVGRIWAAGWEMSEAYLRWVSTWLEMGGDYLIGVSVDQIRAAYKGIDVGLAESLKDNLAWALLPFGIRWLGKAREALAQRTARRLQEAEARQALGDANGAQAILRSADQEIAAERVNVAEVSRDFTQNIGNWIINTYRVVIYPDGGRRVLFRDNNGEFVPATEWAGLPHGQMWAVLRDSIEREFRALEASLTPQPPVPPVTPEPPASQGATAEPASRGQQAPRESGTTSPGLDRFMNQLNTSLTKLKDGNVLNIGNATITKTPNGFDVKVGDGPVTSYPRNAEGVAAIQKKIYREVPSEQLLQSSLHDSVNKGISKAVGREIVSDSGTFRVVPDGQNGFVLEKKWADGGFSRTELNQLTESQADAVMDAVIGKGSSKFFDKVMKNPFNNENFQKIKNIKVKDFFFGSGNAAQFNVIGLKIPKYLYDWTIGDMVKALKKSSVDVGSFTDITILKKAEVLRTLFTGKSRGGYLWSYDGHHGTHRPHLTEMGTWFPSAWMPSGKALATAGVITAGEFYANGKDEVFKDEHWFVNGVNYTWDNSTEIGNNYFNAIYLGVLGSTIVELSEATGLLREGAVGAFNTAKDVTGRVGTDALTPSTKTSSSTSASGGAKGQAKQDQGSASERQASPIPDVPSRDATVDTPNARVI